jgi:hypothetical protein
MKKGLILLIFGQFLTILSINAQKTDSTSVWWHPSFNWNFAGGYTFFDARPTFNQTSFSSISEPGFGGFGALLDVDYSFKNRFGVRFRTAILEKKLNEIGFESNLQNEFPGQYISSASIPRRKRPTTQTVLGPTFSFSKKRFLLQTSLLFGWTKIQLNDGFGSVKKPESNDLLSIKCAPVHAKNKQSSKTLVAGFKIGYFLNDAIVFFGEIEGQTLFHRVQFVRSTRDEITKIRTDDFIKYRQNSVGAIISAGFSFRMD